jgi:hypothetical protein
MNLVYITRDIERALGRSPDTEGYFIISNETAFGKTIAAGRTNILLIPSPKLLDTHELLARPETARLLVRLDHPEIVVFKNTARIEAITRERGWMLLNPSAALASRAEEKISQIEWLGDLARFLPPHRIGLCKHLRYEGAPFILQFNRAHTGSGTFLIDGADALAALQQKFPDRPARATQYLSGVMLTSNSVVGANGTVTANISMQITGLPPFTDQRFATIGNDWALPRTLLTPAQRAEYIAMASAIGEQFRRDGWRGLFGMDVLLDQSSGTLSLIEINARQPASVTCESIFQKTHTTFDAHIAALRGLPVPEIREISDGAQIIYRVPACAGRPAEGSPPDIAALSQKLSDAEFDATPYENTQHGQDLLRIRSAVGIMSAPDVFNARGQAILDCLS